MPLSIHVCITWYVFDEGVIDDAKVVPCRNSDARPKPLPSH